MLAKGARSSLNGSLPSELRFPIPAVHAIQLGPGPRLTRPCALRFNSIHDDCTLLSKQGFELNTKPLDGPMVKVTSKMHSRVVRASRLQPWRMVLLGRVLVEQGVCFSASLAEPYPRSSRSAVSQLPITVTVCFGQLSKLRGVQSRLIST